MSRRRINCGMGGRRGAGGSRHRQTGTNASVTKERIIGREEMGDSRVTTVKCVEGFD